MERTGPLMKWGLWDLSHQAAVRAASSSSPRMTMENSCQCITFSQGIRCVSAYKDGFSLSLIFLMFHHSMCGYTAVFCCLQKIKTHFSSMRSFLCSEVWTLWSKLWKVFLKIRLSSAAGQKEYCQTVNLSFRAVQVLRSAIHQVLWSTSLAEILQPSAWHYSQSHQVWRIANRCFERRT